MGPAVISSAVAACVGAAGGWGAALLAHRGARASEAGTQTRWRGEHQQDAYQSLVMAYEDFQRAAMRRYVGVAPRELGERYQETYWAIDRWVRGVALAGPEPVAELAAAVRGAKNAFHEATFAPGHPKDTGLLDSVAHLEETGAHDRPIEAFVSAANRHLDGGQPPVSHRDVWL
ncbi:hypothetical protein ACFQVC_02425 [Streptomyces monticola]|uniref:Secreted protein n=1 Tax=Streptomyces monticola TaxID=2666263 RepID=A0ABW2JAQ3_9ACTN